MSVAIISVQELANIAYLTGAEVRDLFIAHVANVHEFNQTYADRHEPAELRTYAEILKCLNALRADALTGEFIGETLIRVSLLRYNADEALADEALTRIEAKAFHTYRAIELRGKILFQQDRRDEEAQETQQRVFETWDDSPVIEGE